MEEGEKVSRSVLFWPPSFPPLLLCPQQELVAIDSALSGSFLLVLSALPRNHCLGTRLLLAERRGHMEKIYNPWHDSLHI